MPRILEWPPVPFSPPPQSQYEEGFWMGWRCMCSHLEHGAQGEPVPHYVVDWTTEPVEGQPYPFLPSAVPQFLQDVWYANAKANRPHVRHTLAELKDKHWGLPIFVVGSGPSLAKNMDMLRDNKHGIIIATNDTINLLPEDIKIDYYCVVDGRLPERWWADCKRDTKDIKLLSVPLVTPKVWEYFDDEKIYWGRFAGAEGPNRCFEDYGDLNTSVVEPGYVVGFTATNMAFWMGGNPIVFVGMDCCLQDGFLHAGDNAKMRWLPQERYVVAKDMYGTPCVTSGTYLRGMWKISAAAKLNAVHRHFVNATEGGILTQFVDIVPLKEVIGWQK